jgi:hypothetical protein
VVTAACLLYKEPSGKVHRTGCSLTGYYRPTKTVGSDIDWISHEYDPPMFPPEWEKITIDSFQRLSIEIKQWICDDFRLSRFDMVLAILHKQMFLKREEFFSRRVPEKPHRDRTIFFLGRRNHRPRNIFKPRNALVRKNQGNQEKSKRK